LGKNLAELKALSKKLGQLCKYATLTLTTSFLFKFITFVIISVLLFDRFRLDLAQQHLLVLLRNSAGKAKAQDYALSKNKIEHAEMEKSQTRSRIRKCSVFL
jgi:hypothetical protein